MTAQGELSLQLIGQHRIVDRAAGLNEPSGLTLNADATALYTVSDDTKAVFQMDLEGRLQLSDSFFVDATDLEGVALSHDGRQLLMVQEDTNSIITVDLNQRCEVGRKPLREMRNYDSIQHYFADQPNNKGLEGITVNTRDQHIFVVKEGRPGVLIELDPDQCTILNARVLNTENGFCHPNVSEKKLDFSGLSYDAVRNTIWITSDKGECVFHYDWTSNQVLQRLELSIDDPSQLHGVRKSEGIAIDSKRNRLYVVSERDNVLYIYQIDEHH